MIRVGTAGTPLSAKERTSFGGVTRIAELGLGSMEVEFTYGVRMGKETAKELGALAKEKGVALSVHAPYYVNLNSTEAKKVRDSEKRILQSAELGHIMGARNICFHPGFYSGKKPEEAYGAFYDELIALTEIVEEHSWDVRLCPETTGKRSQFGSWEELTRLCSEIDRLGMTFDFAHAYARVGGKNVYDEAFGAMKKQLGARFLADMHMHFSGIEYTAAGERKHLNLSDGAEPGLRPIADAVSSWKLGGIMVCESPNLEVDALAMKGLL